MKKIVLMIFMGTLMVAARGQATIAFEQLTHNFGTITEESGAVHDFTFTNRGNAPLIIKDVRTSCGCTTPEWPKQPIAPGKTGIIKVSYDTKGRPGAIDKTISVLSNGTTTKTDLRITGEVTPTKRAPAEAYRFPMGALRLSERHVDFAQVYSNEKPSLTVTAWNPSNEPVTVKFGTLPAHIKVTVTPATIKKDETAAIKITYDVAAKKAKGFVIDQLPLLLNGKSDAAFRLTVTADIQDGKAAE